MLAVQVMFTQTFFEKGDADQAHRNLIAFYSLCWQKEQITRHISGSEGTTDTDIVPMDGRGVLV